MISLKLVLKIVILLLFWDWNSVDSKKKSKTVLFQHVNWIHYNSEFHDQLTINISSDHITLNVNFEILRNLPVDPWVRLGVYYLNTKTKYYQKLVHFDVNMCQMFAIKMNNLNLMSVWSANVLKFSNVPRKCPVKKVN